MPRIFGSKLASFGDSLKDAAEIVINKIDDKIDMPIIIDFVGIKTAGEECYSTARETSGLCRVTIEKAQEMVAFGQELQTTLDNVCPNRNSNKKMDASKFEIIRELVEGDRIQSATQLAQDLGRLSLQCVEKSGDMMAAMEKGIDALPDVVQPFVDNKMKSAQKKGAKKGDPALPDVDGSVRELQTLVADVETVTLFTVVGRGSAAFEGLRRKGELSKDMFLSIQNFAEAVESVSDSVRNVRDEGIGLGTSLTVLGNIRTVAKSAWRCLRLSGLMKAFAEQVGTLIRWIVRLFQTASARLGSIWGALARAKDVLAGCMVYVRASIRLCDDSRTKALLLRDTAGEIRDHLQAVLVFVSTAGGAARALGSVRELADGDEILLCIELGTRIDDMFTECVRQVVATIDKVDETIRDLPAVLTVDIPVPELAPLDAEDAEVDDREGERRPSGGNVRSATRSLHLADDVRQLEGMRSDIEGASPLTMIQKSAAGFSGVSDTVGKCGEMITTSRGYAETCRTSIDAFHHGNWDLEVAGGHILELFAVRDAGVQMRDFVEGVLELVRANLALMKAVRSKCKGGGLLGNGGNGGGANIGNLAESFASEVTLDDLKGLGEGLKKFGS
eukprot:CAMPEP_0194330084 /NCGR_PEP_ID=MMETSP0171-20130528/50520_1 /TAXON_ID=218684 /ORGANISM="Corethron pennatum, Strain L29A3" /LENGTH=616 /DNA_ID=CAMNT_0039091031 /DNA_START=34 /DNA_END=1881 /DNA_ORIENTATION=+